MYNICPYCKSEMEQGIIKGDRYPLKWIPKNKERGFLKFFNNKGIRLTDFAYNYITVYYCKNCEKMIFDTKENTN